MVDRGAAWLGLWWRGSTGGPLAVRWLPRCQRRVPSGAEALALWKIVECACLRRGRLWWSHETRATSWAMLLAQRARAVFLRLGGWARLRRMRAVELAAWRSARGARQRQALRGGVALLREGFREDT